MNSPRLQTNPSSLITHYSSLVFAFIVLGRYYYLGGCFVLHVLGVVVALYTGASLNLWAFVWGQIAISAFQLMTHYSNDYFDLEADIVNPTPTQWSGGSRVLPNRELPPRVGLITAYVLAAIGIAATLVLAFDLSTGALTLPLLTLSLLLSWFYSAPPLKLHSRGLGELDVAVVVTGLVPLVGFYLQTGELTLLPFLVIAPLMCLQFATILMINFPDAAGDALTGKRTLVIRMGKRNAARLYNALLIAAYAMLPVLVLMGLPPIAAVGAGLSAPFALWQVWRMSRSAWAQPERWNSLGMWGFALIMLMACGQLIGFLASIVYG